MGKTPRVAVQPNLDLASLCSNPSAVPLIEKHWDVLCVSVMQDEPCRHALFGNPNIISFLTTHWKEIRAKTVILWENMCYISDAVATLIDKHWNEARDHLEWWDFCASPHMIHLIEKHWHAIQDKIDWWGLSANPAIFTLDTTAMREQARPFAEELAARVFHPRRVAAWEAIGIDVEDL